MATAVQLITLQLSFKVKLRRWLFFLLLQRLPAKLVTSLQENANSMFFISEQESSFVVSVADLASIELWFQYGMHPADLL